MHRLGATLRTPTHAIPLGTTIGATSDPKLGLARAEIRITGRLISGEHYKMSLVDECAFPQLKHPELMPDVYRSHVRGRRTTESRGSRLTLLPAYLN